MGSELVEKLLGVCDDALAHLCDGPVHDAVTDVRTALGEPLRVAVAGRVSSGKSTLVNALIGERIAQTAAGECTKLVTWFRYGDRELVEVQPRRGPARSLPFGPGKSMPEALGLPTEDVAYVVVYLKNPLLRRATIIDTPGLQSLTEHHVAQTEAFLGQRPSASAAPDDLGVGEDSSLAVSQAEALVYLINSAVKEDERKVLEQFRTTFSGGNVSALNAVGVLSRIDTLAGETTDPWPTARRIAEKYAARLRSLIMGFQPVIGLLAETAAANALTEADVIDLERLAGLSARERHLMLLAVDRFRAAELSTEVTPERRARLLDLLGLYGVRVCLELIDQGHTGASQIVPKLLELSGLAPLREVLEGSFARRAHAIKAGTALAKLERISFGRAATGDAETLRTIRKALEPIRTDPAMHELEEMRAMQVLGSGEVRLSEAAVDDLVRLTAEEAAWAKLGVPAESTLEELSEAARRKAAEWNAREVMAFDRTTERLARTAKIGYTYVWEELRRQLNEQADAR